MRKIDPHGRWPALRSVLHPLEAVPGSPGWNREELRGLVPQDAALSEAAVLVGLIPREDGLHVLLTLRNAAMRRHAGQVSFPGGRIEAQDPGPAAAAIREAGEEVGLAPGQVEPMGWLDPLTTITGYRVLPLVAAIAPAFVPRPDPGEVAAVFDVPLDFLMAPGNLREMPIEFGGRIRNVLEFVPHDPAAPRIWGATASILLNLRRRLESADGSASARTGN